jgi:hypothetical protein
MDGGDSSSDSFVSAVEDFEQEGQLDDNAEAVGKSVKSKALEGGLEEAGAGRQDEDDADEEMVKEAMEETIGYFFNNTNVEEGLEVEKKPEVGKTSRRKLAPVKDRKKQDSFCFEAAKAPLEFKLDNNYKNQRSGGAMKEVIVKPDIDVKTEEAEDPLEESLAAGTMGEVRDEVEDEVKVEVEAARKTLRMPGGGKDGSSGANWVCTECGKGFTTKGSRVTHTRSVHRGEKPFPCTESGCLARFAASQKLQTHMQLVHWKSRHLVCEVEGCGAGFGHKDYLMAHGRTAHGRPKVVCGVDGCQVGFNWGTHAARHRRRVHGQ